MNEAIKSPKKKMSFSQKISSYGTIFAGIALIIMFSILSPDSFASLDNAINITRQISFLVIIALKSDPSNECTRIRSVDWRYGKSWRCRCC